ncbi:GFA family protein [Leeia aquatica]|uniref:GFA family protein n=1 Tax=Leeia aquatica TaxID=2725557 RepID=A0A847SEB1_9NEIS|nr:GFA family protein [Leeia aquatica]NLR75786.1 GFA family protein [Leeia aquatica]
MELSGQCQCGASRYRVMGEPLLVFACHCKECQRQSASAFGMGLWCRVQTREVSGELATWTRQTPSGRTMDCLFCPQCGSRLFHQLRDQPAILSIKPGTLDDTRWLRPGAHIWTDSAQCWFELDPGVPASPGNPPDFAPLIEAWQRQQGLR